MPPEPTPVATKAAGFGGLWRAVITLVAGGAFAQALPLLLGPWLTRLYTPQDFGAFHLFAAVVANVGVVGCARYEFALPLARGDGEARQLAALCLWVLSAVTTLTVLGAAAWWWLAGPDIACALPLTLPWAVAATGAVSLATLWATRAQAFRALALARVLQYGGAAVLQTIAGVLHAGVTGLVIAPVLATLAALGALRWGAGTGWQGWWREPRASLLATAQRYREFPLLNTPHAFTGALQDTVALALIAAWQGPAAAGFWGLTLRYLKAPATLVGSAVSQALYPRLGQQDGGATPAARQAVLQVMSLLALMAAPLVLGLWLLAPWAFAWAFGEPWRAAGELARALALYIGAHFVAAPLAVVTMAWGAQAWALKLAAVGQVAFVAALAAGLHWGGLQGAGWAVSGAMVLYFGYYFVSLATWPVRSA